MYLLIPLALVALLAAVVLYVWRRPLPQTSGAISLLGLRQSVEVIRDRCGVPHLYAQSEEDVYFAQGFVHAQDRLWQMELFRRIGHGRLSELFGEQTFSLDAKIRTLGFGQAAERDWQALDADTQRIVESYAAGVNACIAQGRLPLEFTLLRLRPEPWRPIDSLVWAKVMTWGLSTNWLSELLQAALVARLGPEKAAVLCDDYRRENPLVLAQQTPRSFLSELSDAFQALHRTLPIPALGGASNSWVVNGSRTTTGLPLLANDPHLSYQMPSIWYENHLACPALEVTGVSIAGSPGVVIGHNREIAWGMTAPLADVQDVFVEKPLAGDPSRYEYQGQAEAFVIRKEQIRVKGERRLREIEVRWSRHGPIINGFTPWTTKPGVPPLALRYVGNEPSTLIRGALRLARAANWHEFSEALRDWTMPAQNFVYADRAGNIGYRLAGKIPIRSKGIGQVPVPGWTGEYEWTGWVPHDELPASYNPPRGCLVAANNQMTGREYPHYLTREPMNGYRARRIEELLAAKERFGRADFEAMLMDQTSLPARDFCAFLLDRAEAIASQPVMAGRGRLLHQALEQLRGWDGVLSADSLAAAIYEVAQCFVMRRLFTPSLGPLTDAYLGHGFDPILNLTALPYLDRTPLVALRLLREDAAAWCLDEAGRPIDRDALLAAALVEAFDFLTARLGSDVSRWRWGQLHQARFSHPLGRQKPLHLIFDRGPYPLGGDANTVWQASFLPSWPNEPANGYTASWRQVMDLSDWDNCVGVHTTGQSGHPASRHYADFIPLWLQGKYHPMWWSRAKVEEHAEARLLLTPAAKQEQAPR